MAEESKEERTARLAAEAQQAVADRAMAAKLKDKEAQDAKDDEPVLIYSVLPTLHLGLRSQKRDLISMENGKLRDVVVQSNKHYSFKDHRVTVRRGDLQALRKIHGYGDRFVELRDSNDGDKNAASLEKWQETDLKRYKGFTNRMKAKQAIISTREFDADSEVLMMIRALKKKAVYA